MRKVLLSGQSARTDDDADAAWHCSLYALIVHGFVRQNAHMERFSPSVLRWLQRYSVDRKHEAVLRRPAIKRMMALEIEVAKNKFIVFVIFDF